MKKILLSMITIAAMSLASYAQPVWTIDSVSMSNASANDVYYSMSNGTARIENNKNWHLGFSMNAGDSSAIWANHNSANPFVKVYNIHKDTSMWNSVTLADTANELLYNTDAGWYAGAFNNKPGVSPFDFGWGKYQAGTHNIIGDSLFIVKANNTFYKLWVTMLQSTAMTYHFRVQDLITNFDTTYSVAKAPNYTNKLFAYFSFATGADTNREPNSTDWDLQFTRYATNAPGSGPMPNNTVIGALSNKGVKIAKANPVQEDTAYLNYATYIASWSTGIAGVGYNWKTYDQGTNSWSVEDSTSYFVQDKAGNLWQLMFTGYSGSATGNIKFGKRIVAPTAVSDVNSLVSQYSVSPNPASTQLSVSIDAKQSAQARINIYNISGSIVKSFPIQVNSGLNAYAIPTQFIPAGNYILNVEGSNININEIFTIQK